MYNIIATTATITAVDTNANSAQYTIYLYNV